MIFGLILRSTEETVYSYDTERKQCQFTDKATEEYYKKKWYNGLCQKLEHWATKTKNRQVGRSLQIPSSVLCLYSIRI